MTLAAVRLYGNVVHIEPERTALGDIHRKRRFADRRTRRYNDHFRLLKSLQLLVKMGKTSRQSLKCRAVRFEHVVQPLEALIDRARPRHSAVAADADFEKRFLGLAENGLWVGPVAFVVAFFYNLGRSLDHKPAQILRSNDADIMLGMRRSRSLVDKRLDIPYAADAFEFSVDPQGFDENKRVKRFT